MAFYTCLVFAAPARSATRQQAFPNDCEQQASSLYNTVEQNQLYIGFRDDLESKVIPREESLEEARDASASWLLRINLRTISSLQTPTHCMKALFDSQVVRLLHCSWLHKEEYRNQRKDESA